MILDNVVKKMKDTLIPLENEIKATEERKYKLSSGITWAHKSRLENKDDEVAKWISVAVKWIERIASNSKE